jgi:transposase
VFVRPLADAERDALAAGLRSPDAVVLRRCQILLASARGAIPRVIGEQLGCHDQTVRSAIAAFNARGRAALRPGSSRPRTVHAAFSAEQVEHLRAMPHRSPRAFGKETGLWTVPLAAGVSLARGIGPALVTGETVRATLARLGVRGKRAKPWITSPDPQDARTKGRALA